MSDNNSQGVIEQIHASGKQLVLSATGGGSGAIAALLAVPGASASVLEAVVPYAATALEEWLGGAPEQYCSERTARAMAMAAFERARALSARDARTLRGIGATASLATTRPKRGAHRVHAAWQSAEVTTVVSCELGKGKRTRAEEEAVAAGIMLYLAAEACGVAGESLLDETIRSELQRRTQEAPSAWTELLLGERTAVSLNDGVVEPALPAQKVLFPGAFNPLHAGHARMAELAAERCGAPVTFELSIANVDKPPLDFLEIADRLQQFSGRRVLLTRAPTFVEKAQIAPGCIFAVGADTLARIADSKYYGGEMAQRDAALAEIARAGSRFLVFGRMIEGRFITLADLDLPPALREICDQVAQVEFQVDISSTKLRGS